MHFATTVSYVDVLMTLWPPAYKPCPIYQMKNRVNCRPTQSFILKFKLLRLFVQRYIIGRQLPYRQSSPNYYEGLCYLSFFANSLYFFIGKTD